jgi:hypothetical protein
VLPIIGTAAFAGLRQGEIRGLWVEDDEGDVLNIRRSVWRTIVKETKTEEDEDDPGVVPIVRPLRLLIDRVKPAHGWLFPNTLGGPLDLHNLAERVIKPRFAAKGLAWKGWHAYRRGLATNLHALGVDDKTIQAILRHDDVSTTQRSYSKTPSRIVTDAMKQLEATIACATGFGELIGKLLKRMEPTIGLEPMTCRLRNRSAPRKFLKDLGRISAFEKIEDRFCGEMCNTLCNALSNCICCFQVVSSPYCPVFTTSFLAIFHGSHFV